MIKAIKMEFEKRCSAILANYPDEGQMVKAIEEMAELTQLICKSLLLVSDPPRTEYQFEIREEIADCFIMLVQMRELFGKEEVDNLIDLKLQRTENRIENESYDQL